MPLAQALAIMGVPQGFVSAAISVSDEPWVLIAMMIGILIAAISTTLLPDIYK